MTDDRYGKSGLHPNGQVTHTRSSNGVRHPDVWDLTSLGSCESGGVLDHIRCDLIVKRVSGETPVGFLLNLEKNQRFFHK